MTKIIIKIECDALFCYDCGFLEKEYSPPVCAVFGESLCRNPYGIPRCKECLDAEVS